MEVVAFLKFSHHFYQGPDKIIASCFISRLLRRIVARLWTQFRRVLLIISDFLMWLFFTILMLL